MLLFQKNDEKKEYVGPPRIGFSFSYSAHLNCSILFGGCKDVDVHLYDHSKREWSWKSTAGSKKQPRPCKYHAAAVIESLPGLIVSGGQDQSGHSLDDIYLLAFKDWRWRKLILYKSPIARERHSLIPISKTELILFGGVSMPYSEHTNDCWMLISKSDNKQEPSFDCSQLPTKGPVPEGACYSESTVLVGDRLFTGSYRGGKNQPIELFSLDLRSRSWKKLELKLMVNELKFYKIVPVQSEQTLILSTTDGNPSSSPKFYLFNHHSLSLTLLQQKSPLYELDKLVSDPNTLSCTICAVKNKNIFTLSYFLSETTQNEPVGSIQDYLIAIKHEQLLSQQLNRKNGLLEELYKEMQNYITVLNREYMNYECDLNVQNQKSRHIEDCQVLKNQYSRLNHAYEDAVTGIRALRGELSAINQDFERCIETEFDEEA